MDEAHRRERVDDSLWVMLGWIAEQSLLPRQTAVFSTGGGAPEEPSGRGAVDAFERVGLLEPAAAAHWRALFEDAAAPAPPLELTDELRARVDAYVDHPAVGDGEARLRLQTVINDLRLLGAANDEQVQRRFTRLAGPTPDAEQFVPEPSLDRYVRSIPGPGERRRGLRILLIDLFEDGIVVHYHLARRGRARDGSVPPLPDEVEPHAPLVERTVSLGLTDDLGTVYQPHHGGAGGSGVADRAVLIEGAAGFGPALAGQARALAVTCESTRFELRL